jgi:hypothetical protein
MRICGLCGSELSVLEFEEATTVSRSSTEAEYTALANGVAKTMWISSLLTELRVT